MLSSVVLNEIFNIKYRISDQAIEHISDELDKFRCVISRVDDNDLAITICFDRCINNLPIVEGEIRIDRVMNNFGIIGSCDGLMLPINGDWSMILTYLEQLTCS